MDEEYLTVEEVAAMFKVDIETVYRWLRNGVIPGIKIGRLWRVKRDDLKHLEYASREGASDG